MKKLYTYLWRCIGFTFKVCHAFFFSFLEMEWDRSVPWNRITAERQGKRVVQTYLVLGAAAAERLAEYPERLLRDEKALEDDHALKEDKMIVCKLAFHLMIWEKITIASKIVNTPQQLERKKLEIAKAIDYDGADSILAILFKVKGLYRQINGVSFAYTPPLQVKARDVSVWRAMTREEIREEEADSANVDYDEYFNDIDIWDCIS